MIIDNLQNNSIIKKYIRLMKTIIKKMDEENRVICELLVSSPYKYKELVYTIYTNLGLSLLPKEDTEFYVFKNYKDNEIKYNNFSVKEEEISELKKLLFSQNEIINNLKSKINGMQTVIDGLQTKTSKLEADSTETKKTLLNIQIRDIISSFIDQISWIFHVKVGKDFLNNIQNVLESLVGNNNQTTKIIIDLLTKSSFLKKRGNDFDHPVKNIRFNSLILPDEIKRKYDNYKTNNNNFIENCDCLALIVSNNKINNSSTQITQKKYNLLNEIIADGPKDWETNKQRFKSILIDYENKI